MSARAALLAVFALFVIGAFWLLGNDEDASPGSIAAGSPEARGAERERADLSLVANGAHEHDRIAVDAVTAPDGDPNTGDSSSTWADLLAPHDDRTGLPLPNFRIDVLTAFDAEVKRIASDAPLDERLLSREALARIVVPGFSARVFVTADVASLARPIAMPMRATTTVQIDVLGEVPAHRPVLELAIWSDVNNVGRRASRWFDVGPVARPDIERTLGWSGLLESERSRRQLAPSSEGLLSAFDAKLVFAEGEAIESRALHDVPVGARLAAQLRIQSIGPGVSATFLREDGTFERHPFVMDREVLEDGGTTITLQFGGTSTLRWSFDTLVGHSSGSFKLFDLSNKELNLTASPEPIATAGGALDPTPPTRREFAARNIPPGRYTFWALWKHVDGSTGSCELPVTLPADETLDVGDLTSDPRYSVEIVPRLTVGEGVPDDLAQEVRRSIEWTASASPADSRRDAFGNANQARKQCTGLDEVVVLEDVAPGAYYVGGDVRSTPGLEREGTFTVLPVYPSSFVVDEDERVEVEFRLVSTADVVIIVPAATTDRTSWMALAFQNGEAARSSTLVVPLEPRRGANMVKGERTELSCRLGPGAWRVVVVEQVDLRDEPKAIRVATANIIVGATPPEPVQAELLGAVSLAIEVQGDASTVAQKLFASPQLAVVPTGWPELAAMLSLLDRDNEDVLRYLALFPHTEYTLLADGSTFLTGAPGSALTLLR